jgi:hypothetical protein
VFHFCAASGLKARHGYEEQIPRCAGMTAKTQKRKTNRKPQQDQNNPETPLIAQGVAVGRLRAVWSVERLAEFAAIDFDVLPD